jgi:hypothetical protein
MVCGWRGNHFVQFVESLRVAGEMESHPGVRDNAMVWISGGLGQELNTFSFGQSP